MRRSRARNAIFPRSRAIVSLREYQAGSPDILGLGIGELTLETIVKSSVGGDV